ncbi:MAG: type III pantothenate kinase [Planctomycetes bacterium]|nr:type III pantothenate kinase [Planctomycetota bacterium]
MSALLAISVGNTCTSFGRFVDRKLVASERVENAQEQAIVDGIATAWGELADPDAIVVIASVNDAFAAPLKSKIEKRLKTEVLRIGSDLPVPIGICLDAGATPGQDRLLAAAAAYDSLKQAVVVVDAGTAMTVDFVDGEGVFHGGAIIPGAALQLKSLHEHTAALPRVAFAQPDPKEPFGRNTAAAMLLGVYEGMRGAMHRLVERYAEHYKAFPMVVVTGGDADVLFTDDDLVDRHVPDLVLMGIRVAAEKSIEEDSSDHDASVDAREE